MSYAYVAVYYLCHLIQNQFKIGDVTWFICIWCHLVSVRCDVICCVADGLHVTPFPPENAGGTECKANRQMLENIFLLKAVQLILGFFSSLNMSLACNIILLFPPYVFLYSVCNSLWQSSSRFHMRGGDHTTPCSQTFHPFAASQSHWADLTPSALPRATHGHRKWLSAILESPRRRGIQTPPKIHFAGNIKWKEEEREPGLLHPLMPVWFWWRSKNLQKQTLNGDVQLLKSVKKRRDGLGLVAIGNDVIGCKHANASTASSPFMMMMWSLGKTSIAKKRFLLGIARIP